MLLKLSKIQYLIFGVILLELFLGGGGRLIEFGSLTLRMYLFGFGLVLSAFILFHRYSIDIYVIIISAISMLALLLSTLIGLINGAPLALIALDVKPLIFFLFIITTFSFIHSKKDIIFITKLLKFSAILLSVVYLVTLFLLYKGYIDFNMFWNSTYDYHEFFFRGTQGFFTYKGFLYMGIGFIFWERLTINRSLKVLALIIIGTAILLTGTRGFIVSLALIYFSYLVVPKLFRGNIFYFFFMCLAIFISYYFISNNDLGDKISSDALRILQIEEVFQATSFKSSFFGHGFGIGIPSKPVHIELAYLEIFHKQGILGIVLWLVLILYVYVLYSNLKCNRKLAQPFILSTVFVFVMSFTNPYINNPIGLTIILISVVILNILNNKE